MKQGEKIVIENITKKLEVSNSPVREAINMLINDGLLVKLKNEIRVIKLTANDMMEITEAIISLLIGSYKLCIYKNNRNDIIEKMSNDLINQKKHFEEKDEEKFLRSAIHFDENLIMLTENKKLINVIEKLNDLFTLIVRDFQFDEYSKKKSLLEHEKILNSIINNDFEETEKCIIEHYINSTEYIIKMKF